MSVEDSRVWNRGKWDLPGPIGCAQRLADEKERAAGIAADEAKLAAWRKSVEDHKARMRAYREAYSGHPLVDAVSGQSEAALRATNRPYKRFTVRNFGNGHVEASAYVVQPDVEKRLEKAIDQDLRRLKPRGEGDVEGNRGRNVRRAKATVRHKCKAMLVNSLWTLTYKVNVLDREQALRDFDRFRRKVEALIPGWRYIAVLEKQARGSWHVHLATHALPFRLVDGGLKVKSWDVMRAIWRRVTGERGGNFDEAKRNTWGADKRKTKPIRGADGIASYIAGYVAKEMAQSEINRKRYSSSKGIELPEPYRAQFVEDVTMLELIELCYAAVGDRVTRSWFDAERGVFFLSTDDTGGASG